jgi:N-methylhydantoinase A/oxoprolinase/acetone carboxylase beta subunit
MTLNDRDTLCIGVDVGGTFTDVVLTGSDLIHHLVQALEQSDSPK